MYVGGGIVAGLFTCDLDICVRVCGAVYVYERTQGSGHNNSGNKINVYTTLYLFDRTAKKRIEGDILTMSVSERTISH